MPAPEHIVVSGAPEGFDARLKGANEYADIKGADVVIEAMRPYISDHLANGGRLFQVVGQGASARAQLVTRVADEIFHREELFETALPALINAPEPERFVF